MTNGPLLLAALGLGAILFAGFRHFVHRGLAPERVPERRSPADLGLPHQDVRIPTRNGKTLFGWFLPVPGVGQAPAVLILHGWGGNAEMMLPLAAPLHDAGFALLFVDARCHGSSDDDAFTSLPRFAEDLEHALGWASRQAAIDPRQISLLGHSVGAGAALLLASRRKDIAAVVSIAAFSHPASMMRRWLAFRHIPYWPLGWAVLRYVQHVIGYRFDDIAPVRTIAAISCPTLLIHGAADETVPAVEAQAIHAARVGNHVELKIIAGSHDDFGDSDDVAAETRELVDFLLRHSSQVSTAVRS